MWRKAAPGPPQNTTTPCCVQHPAPSTHLPLVQVLLVPQWRPPTRAGAREGLRCSVTHSGFGGAAAAEKAAWTCLLETERPRCDLWRAQAQPQHTAKLGSKDPTAACWPPETLGMLISERGVQHPKSAAGLTWLHARPRWAGFGAPLQRPRWGGWARSWRGWRRCPPSPP